MFNIDKIITETINRYINENVWDEADDKASEDEKEEEKDSKEEEKKDSEENGHKKKKKFRKNAIKGKGGLRKDFDVESDEEYNSNVDDQEQSSVQDILTNGFVNIKKVAEKLYPDHTPEGAQSQLSKKLRGDKSDSGSTYKLKTKEVKKLRHIIASYLK